MIAHSYPTIAPGDVERVVSALNKRVLSTGSLVSEFESMLARYFGKQYVVATSSGTAALHVLLAARLRRGDAVLVPGYVCSAVPNAARLARLIVQYGDVDRDGNLVDPGVGTQVGDVRAIILTHTFGKEAVVKLPRNGMLVHDCSHRFCPPSTPGDVVVSFNATKPITTGVGGAVLTDNESLYRLLSASVSSEGFDETIRYPYRMSDVQAALGIGQLEQVTEFSARRQAIAQYYSAGLDDLPLDLPSFGDSDFVYRYVVKAQTAAEAIRILAASHERGIRCERPIDPPNECKGLTGVKNALDLNVSLPIYPSLSMRDAETVIDTIRSTLRSRRWGS